METPAEKLMALLGIVEGAGVKITEAKLRVSDRDDSAHYSVKFEPAVVTLDEKRRKVRIDGLWGQDPEKLIRQALNMQKGVRKVERF